MIQSEASKSCVKQLKLWKILSSLTDLKYKGVA